MRCSSKFFVSFFCDSVCSFPRVVVRWLGWYDEVCTKWFSTFGLALLLVFVVFSVLVGPVAFPFSVGVGLGDPAPHVSRMLSSSSCPAVT